MNRYSFYIKLRKADLPVNIEEIFEKLGMSHKFNKEKGVYLVRRKYAHVAPMKESAIEDIEALKDAPKKMLSPEVRRQLHIQARQWIRMPDYVFEGSKGVIQRFSFQIPGHLTKHILIPFSTFDDLMMYLFDIAWFKGLLWQDMEACLDELEYYPVYNFRFPIILVDPNKLLFLNISKYTHKLRTGKVVKEYVVEHDLVVDPKTMEQASEQSVV